MPVTGPGYAGPTSTFVPTFEASNKLIVAFSRNPKTFKLPQYVQYQKAPLSAGYYLKLTPEEAARVVSVQDYAFPDGAESPTQQNVESFNFVGFFTKRYRYAFTLGNKAVQQATWEIFEQHAAIQAAKCMTSRTIRMLDRATATGNWPSAHTGTATAIGGGKWNVGTSLLPYILNTLNAAAVQIVQDTLGVVSADQLIVVVNPNTAKGMSQSPEFHDYAKGSYVVQKMLEEGLGSNARYGLTDTLYGYKVIVEDCVRISSRPGAAQITGFALPDGVALIVSRPGGLVGTFGGASYSTLVDFLYEEMTVERYDDVKNRRAEGYITEDSAEEIVAPVSGMLITAVI